MFKNLLQESCLSLQVKPRVLAKKYKGQTKAALQNRAHLRVT